MLNIHSEYLKLGTEPLHDVVEVLHLAIAKNVEKVLHDELGLGTMVDPAAHAVLVVPLHSY